MPLVQSWNQGGNLSCATGTRGNMQPRLEPSPEAERNGNKCLCFLFLQPTSLSAMFPIGQTQEEAMCEGFGEMWATRDLREIDLRLNGKITNTRCRRHKISNFIILAAMVFSHPYFFSVGNMKIYQK